MQRPMSINGYSWVEGNTPNMTDPSGKSPALAATLNAGVCQSQNQECPGITYTVRPGDTFDSIANTYGIDRLELALQNGITNPALVSVGLTLCIPGVSSCTSYSCCLNRCGGNTTSAFANCMAQCTIGLPTATPYPQASCPTDSLLGCFPGTAVPIVAAVVYGAATHTVEEAVDFVPADIVDRENNSYINPNWERNIHPDFRTVHSVVSGEVILPDFSGDIRIRTSEGICYDYKHISTDGTNISFRNGQFVDAGTPLGMIESHTIDPDAGQPSHGHLAIFPCDESGQITEQGSQIPPLSVLNPAYLEE